MVKRSAFILGIFFVFILNVVSAIDFPSTTIEITFGGNSTNFTQLLDTPISYVSYGGMCVVVKDDEAGLEFTNCSNASDTTCDGDTCNIDNTGTLDGYNANELLDDTNETTRFNVLTGTDCSEGDFVNGVGDNGALICDTPIGGGTGDNSSWNESYANTLYVPYTGAIDNVNLSYDYYLMAGAVVVDAIINFGGSGGLNLTDPSKITPFEGDSVDLGGGLEDHEFRNAYFSENVTADYFNGLVDCSDIYGATSNLCTLTASGEEADPFWTGNYSTFLTISAWNNTGLIKDWNATGLIQNWSEIIVGGSDNSSWNESYANTLYIKNNTNEGYIALLNSANISGDLYLGDTEQGYDSDSDSWGFDISYIGNLIINIIEGWRWDDNGNIFANNSIYDGNVTASEFYGDGSHLTGISGATDTNCSVEGSCGLITYDSELDYYTDSDIDGSETAFDGWDKNSGDDFSGSWNDLSDIPAGFSDGIDNVSEGGADWTEITSIPAGFDDDVDNDTQYTNGSGISLVGTEFNHSDTSSQASDDNSGNDFIQDIVLDTFGHITSLTHASVDLSAYVAIANLVGLVGNWSADKSNYYNSTQVDTNIENANTSVVNWVTAQGYITDGLTWEEAINGTLMQQSTWDANYSANNDAWLNMTNSSYYLASNPDGFITNSTMNKTVSCEDIEGSPDTDFCTDVDTTYTNSSFDLSQISTSESINITGYNLTLDYICLTPSCSSYMRYNGTGVLIHGG